MPMQRLSAAGDDDSEDGPWYNLADAVDCTVSQSQQNGRWFVEMPVNIV
jgi:hypothetical protein